MSDEAKSWKDKLTFLEPDGVEHTIEGTAVMFYPVRLGTLFEIKVIGAPLAKALAVLFDDKGRDYGTVSRNFYQPNSGQADQRMDNELIVEPRTPDMAALRAKQREESIEGLIEALLNEKSKAVIGKLIRGTRQGGFQLSGDTITIGGHNTHFWIPWGPSTLTRPAYGGPGQSTEQESVER